MLRASVDRVGEIAGDDAEVLDGAWLRAAGFEEVRRLGIVRPPSRRRMRQFMAVLAARAGSG